MDASHPHTPPRCIAGPRISDMTGGLEGVPVKADKGLNGFVIFDLTCAETIETIVIKVAFSEKNSLENKIHELTTLATADERAWCRAPQLYVAKREVRPAVAQPRAIHKLSV
ncbi:hypothetical protein EVAR_50022_1 [Eumeta japonica]|uniref:Uncharacterized protein n=1 Tax=Eumeta variegata TaxID=151549 RepID=A0A4C1YS22_EUMVA|nr:hypothetical protein EVAR_50022_1 [Eumeta japonica]